MPSKKLKLEPYAGKIKNLVEQMGYSEKEAILSVLYSIEAEKKSKSKKTKKKEYKFYPDWKDFDLQVAGALEELKSLGNPLPGDPNKFYVSEITKDLEYMRYKVFLTNGVEKLQVNVSYGLVEDSGLSPAIIACNIFEQEYLGKIAVVDPYIEQQFLAFGSAMSKNGVNPYQISTYDFAKTVSKVDYASKFKMWDLDSLVTKSKKPAKPVMDSSFKISDPDDLILL